MGRRGGRSRRAFLTSIIIVGLLWIMFGSVVTARKLRGTTMILVSTTSSGDSSNSKHWKFIDVVGSDGKPDDDVEEEDLHLNYVSKRRIPTGPDPIHNRKTVLRFSRQAPPPPPGPI